MILEREQHGLVQVLTMNRPEAANSLNPELLADLAQAFHEIETDDATQVVILTGAGERIFCAGMDLREFGERPDRTTADDPPAAAAVSLNFRDMSPKPVIAAVNGAAVGGGMDLVLACDLVVAVETARFGCPEVKRGLFSGGGGTLLGTRLPLPLALELALTGELIDATRAASWGLVNRVVPAAELRSASLALAGSIAANGPLAVRILKRLVRRAVLVEPTGGWATPEDLAAVYGSEDAKEGALAFLEKRLPSWKGR